jgi:hypothetical protein
MAISCPWALTYFPQQCTEPHQSVCEFYVTPTSSKQVVDAVHLDTTVSAQDSLYAELAYFRKPLTKMVTEPQRCIMLSMHPSRKSDRPGRAPHQYPSCFIQNTFNHLGRMLSKRNIKITGIPLRKVFGSLHPM